MVKSTFIAADAPMPPTGGGVRTLNFVRTLSEKTICDLFVLFPINKSKFPDVLLKNCNQIISSDISFSSPSVGRLSSILTQIRWILAPWSFKKNELILLADYLVINPYLGKNVFAKFLHVFQKYLLVTYAFILYRFGYKFSARSLERFNQFNELKNDITRALKSSNIIWIDFSTLLVFFPNLKKTHPDSIIICNAHNVEYKVLERMELLAKDKLGKKWYRKQASVMKDTELKGFCQCDYILTCSEIDKNEIKRYLPSSSVHVYPNGVDTNFFIPDHCITEYPSLLFTGTMGYKPTNDAVQYFIEKIFPLVRQENPECKFIIAGSNAARVFKQYEGRDDIEILSSPTDMRPAYNKSWVVVVPLRVGGGTRLKILEAMAMKKPVVSTSIGMEGIDVSNNEHLFISDEEKDFAEKINFLIRNPDLRYVMATNANKRVIDLYGWDIIRHNLSELIQSLS